MVFSKRAWLITWEPITSENRQGYNVVTILNYRVSDGRIKEKLEQLYVDNTMLPSERLSFAKSKKNIPNLVRFDSINKVPWWGRMWCGVSPYLYARQVRNLIVKEDNKGNEYFQWEEINKPNNKLLE